MSKAPTESAFLAEGLQLGGGKPLHAQVRARLMDKISEMKAGEKLPSERDLAKQLNLGRVTVRRAILDMANEGFIVRHAGRGSFVTETASGAAGVEDDGERLEAAPSADGQLALVMPSDYLTCHTDLIEGVRHESRRRGVDLLVYGCEFDRARERQTIQSLLKQDLSGLIVSPFREDSIDEGYARLIRQVRDAGMPLVLLDQYVPECQTRVAMPDHVQIGYSIAEHLIMLGHRRICFASTGGHDITGRDHVRGFRMALDDYGVEFDPKLMVEQSIHFCAEPTGQDVARILKHNARAFTAIGTSQFSMTFGIVRVLEAMGIRTPDDISLVGADVHQNAKLEYVTHVSRRYFDVGVEAVKLLLNTDENASRKLHSLVKPHLVIRKSCGAHQLTRDSDAKT